MSYINEIGPGDKMPKDAKIGDKVKLNTDDREIVMERVKAFGKNKNLKWKIRSNKMKGGSSKKSSRKSSSSNRAKPHKTGETYQTVRTINGERRKVQVTKLRGGKESVKVVYPKNKNIPENNRSKNLKGVAKGNYLNSKRPPGATTVDKKSTANEVLRPTNAGIEEWRKAPNRKDLKGVDTKK